MISKALIWLVLMVGLLGGAISYLTSTGEPQTTLQGAMLPLPVLLFTVVAFAAHRYRRRNRLTDPVL